MSLSPHPRQSQSILDPSKRSWPELQDYLLNQARLKGRSKDGPALPQQAGQVSHRTQEAGVGGGGCELARWGWGSDLSGEPWMNQPDHSHPTAVMVYIGFLPSVLIFLSLLFPKTWLWQGCGTRVVTRGTTLDLEVRLDLGAGQLILSFPGRSQVSATPPRNGQQPCPEWNPHILCGLGFLSHLYESSAWPVFTGTDDQVFG